MKVPRRLTALDRLERATRPRPPAVVPTPLPSGDEGGGEALAAHEADTTAVHGIADTSVLATKSEVASKQDASSAATDAELATEEAARKAADAERITKASADESYAPQTPKLVVPIFAGGSTIPNSTITVTAKRLYIARVIIPVTGKLRDIAVYIATKSGNYRAAVYDTGDAAAGKRTRKYDSGSVAVATANAWNIIADPNLAVTRGQQFDLIVQFDNATVTFGRGVAATNGTAHKLPANFDVVPGGAEPKLWGIGPTTAEFGTPTTLKESEVEEASSPPLIIARIS